MTNVAVRMPNQPAHGPEVCHSRESGNPVLLTVLGSPFRGNDKLKHSVILVPCPFALSLSPSTKAACRSGSRTG